MFNLDSICRICLTNVTTPIIQINAVPSDSSSLVDSNSSIENSLSYEELINELICNNSNEKANSSYQQLPKKICPECASSVLKCYQFKRKIIKSEKILINQILKQHELEEVDVAMDIESLESAIEVIGNVVRIKLNEGCNKICGQCSETDCSRRITENNNPLEIDSCRFCGEVNKSTCNICSVADEKADISSLEVASIAPSDEEKEEFRCSECQKVFATKSRLKKHVMTHSPDKPFHCLHCKWSFSTEAELNTHNLVNHNAEGKNECVYCMKSFKEKRLLRQHMISHKQQKRFHCKVCQKGFNLAHHLRNHEKIHENKSDFECDVCHKKFITKDRLSSHIKIHQGKDSRCDKCGKAFLSEAALKAHIQTHSKDEGVLICPGCGLKFVDSAKFNRHRKSQCVNTVKMALNETVRVACLVCSVIFESEQAMKEHMKTHSNQFICPTCNKSFLQETTLKNHLKTHTIRNFTCEICNESFNRSDHLKNHIARKHPTHSDNEYQHQCYICSKKFLQAGELNIHMRIHTKTRPFACKTCNKTFTQANQLKSHERLHSNERPYACNICNQSYASQSGLNQHLAHQHTAIIKEDPEIAATMIFVDPTVELDAPTVFPANLSPLSQSDFL